MALYTTGEFVDDIATCLMFTIVSLWHEIPLLISSLTLSARLPPLSYPQRLLMASA